MGVPEPSRESSGNQEGSVISPKDDAVAHGAEEVIGVRVHGDDMATVGVVFQGLVYPVHEGVLLFLCEAGKETARAT